MRLRVHICASSHMYPRRSVRGVESANTDTPDAYRWEAIRATEGWAGLQHHTLLHTTVTVTPPSDSSQKRPIDPPRLLVELQQGSFFTILPLHNTGSSTGFVPKWYMGNIYAMNWVLPQTVPLPAAPSLTGPTTYDLFVSGDYEVWAASSSPASYSHPCIEDSTVRGSAICIQGWRTHPVH